jgi:hypothetical protein
MGTSSSYPGPPGTTLLLPPWADEPLVPEDLQPDGDDSENAPDTDEPADGNTRDGLDMLEPLVSWRGPKTLMTRWARGDDSVSLGSVGRSYVGASGGSRGATASSFSGRATTARIGGFLADGLRNGFAQAARNLGLGNLVGRDAQFVLASFIDLLVPAGALLEAAAARKAGIETMSELFRRFDVETNGLAALDALDPTGMLEVVELSVTNFVNERFQQELVSRIERGAISEQRANTLSSEVKGFITGIVKLDLRGVDPVGFDWRGAPGASFVARIYRAAYSLLGDAV